jgi:hypothetical protein
MVDRNGNWLTRLNLHTTILQPAVGGTLLNIGCGDAQSHRIHDDLLTRLQPSHATVIDAHPPNVEAFRRRELPNHTCEVRDIREWEFGFYDGIVFSHVAEHMSEADLRKVLARIIVSCNACSLETPAFWSKTLANPKAGAVKSNPFNLHHILVSKELLAEYGFSFEGTIPAGPGPYDVFGFTRRQK